MTMDIGYGIDVLPENDPYIEIAEQGIESVTESAIPGHFLVDLIPICELA